MLQIHWHSKPGLNCDLADLMMNGMKIILLIFIIFLTIIVSILISIIVIIKYRNKDIGIQIFALILISVASQFVSGNAILMIIIGLLIYDLLENWEFSINKLQK